MLDEAEDKTEFDLLAGVEVDLLFSTTSFLMSSKPGLFATDSVLLTDNPDDPVDPILISQTWRLLPCKMAAALFGRGNSAPSSTS